MGTNAATQLVGAANPAAAILPLFDDLAPGERVTLVLARENAPFALKALQKERKGTFDWSPRAEERSVEIELFRRDAAPGALRRVTEALAWDHDRLEAIEARAFEARAASDLAAARSLYAAFAAGLKRHIGFEEELLFPEFERRLGFTPQAGPTAVMRFEHRQIELLLDRLAREIGEADTDPETTRAQLQAVLGDHNMKEERIVYPHTDGAMSPEEADALVASIQAY